MFHFHIPGPHATILFNPKRGQGLEKYLIFKEVASIANFARNGY